MAARIRIMGVALRQVPGLSGLVLFYGLVSVFITTNHLYGQTTLAAKGAPILLVTLILAAANLAGALASLLVGRWATRPGFPAVRVLRTATLLLALLLAAVGALPLFGAATAFVVDGVADGTVDPVATATLSRLAPDSVRATVLSAPDTLFSLGMIILFPAAGWLMGARELGIPLTYAVMAGLVLVAGGVPLARWRGTDTAPAQAPPSAGLG
jgi:MFS family permease